MNTLVAQERDNFRKSALKRLRDEGNIPAIVYGNNIETKSISIKKADLLKVVKVSGRNGIFTLNLDGSSRNVMLRDYQNNPVTKDILHVDLLQVDKNTTIDTKVSVILKGTSKGEKAGGITQQFLHELDVTAKANEIPETIEIDVSDFDIGHSVSVADIQKDYSNCTFNHESEETIVMVEYLKPETEDEESSTGEAVEA